MDGTERRPRLTGTPQRPSSLSLHKRFRSPPIALLGRIFGNKAPAAQPPASLHLAAFGKHPGWDDHIDDQGLDTERLVWFKSMLYLNGIGARLDSGAWEKLEPDQQVEAFAHIVLTRIGGDILAARLWSSRDGKGRTRYPFVVVAQVSGGGGGASVEWVVSNVLPELERLQQRCESVGTASEVVQVLDQSRASLRQMLADNTAPVSEITIPGSLPSALAAMPELAPEGEGLFRVLYQLEREASFYLRTVPGKDPKSTSVTGRAHTLRVPRCAPDAAAALLLWTRLLLTRIEPAAPMTVIAPLKQDWVDAIIGEPGGAEMFCLRAGLKSIPLSTQIPYSMDAEFMTRARQWLDVSRAQPDVVVESVAKSRRESGLFGAVRGKSLLLASVLACTLAGRQALAQSESPPASSVPQGAPARTATVSGEPSSEPKSRYNTLLRAFAAELARPGIADADADRLARGFLADVRALPGGVAYLGRVSDVLAAIDRALEGKPEPAPRADVPIGPAATGSYRLETTSSASGARVLRFVPTSESSSTPSTGAIEFVYVDAAPGSGVDGPFYIARTELTIEQALAVLRDRKNAAVFREVMPPVSPDDETRVGIRTWEWSSGANPMPRPARTWFRPFAGSGSVAMYPAGAEPLAPGRSTPLQQLTAPGAAFFAAALGCRLPTPAEWRAARAAQPRSEVLANLRDRRWKIQQDYVESMLAKNRSLPSADDGAFVPNDVAIPDGPRSARTVDQDDGLLWIAQAQLNPDSPPLLHMMGNVAEFTVDLPRSAAWPSPEMVALSAWVEKTSQNWGVIGGSALSDPAIDVLTAQATKPLDLFGGYSDVGVRLVFYPTREQETVRTTKAGALLGAVTPLPTLDVR